MLKPGIYEQIIDQRLRDELDRIPPERKSLAPVDPAEAADVLSKYIAEAARRILCNVGESGGMGDQIALTNRMIGCLPEMQEKHWFG